MEYERRSEEVGAVVATAIALELSRDRRDDEIGPSEVIETDLEKANADGQPESAILANNEGDDQ